MTDVRPPDHDATAHLGARQVASFLDGALRGAERDAVTAHLADCAPCRSEVVELRRALDAVGGPRRTWPFGTVAIAALAAGAAFVIAPALARRPPEEGPRPSATRAAGTAPTTDAEPRVAAVAPHDEALVAGAAPTLVWRPAGAGAMYRVTVQDSAGSVAWSDTVEDTVATVAARPPLLRGQRYFWSVDARLADGQAITTGVRSFTVR